MAPTPDQERDYVAHLDGLSSEQIRHDMTHGFIPPSFVHAVSRYLSKRELDSISDQKEIALREADAADRAANAAERAASAADRAATAAELQATEARRANIRATIALTIAIISIIATTIGTAVSIWITHMDAHK
jgi:hypothetical protein